MHELNLLFRRVTQAFDAQKNFVADAAHELRTPLAALKLQVQALRRAGDEVSRDTAIARLNAGIDRATRLIEQLLVLARQQSGSQGLVDAQSVDLIATAKAVLAEMAPLAESKQIELRVDMDSDAQAKVTGQPDALRILLRNLLDNAIKYTPAFGHVRVAVATQTGVIRLTVEDSGPGIAPADRSRVLDRFYRVAGSEVSGSGLGLAIVKTIADAHQASITLDESDALGGLRLTLRFPAAV